MMAATALAASDEPHALENEVESDADRVPSAFKLVGLAVNIVGVVV